MKIGILTQPLQTNYGGLLQNYALQQVLIHMGHEPETILYEDQKKKMTFVSRLSYIKRFLLHSINPKWFKGTKYVPINNERAYIRQNTQAFIEKYIRKTDVLKSHEDFISLVDKRKYQTYVVGSDQCWRPKYNKTFLREMFLGFAEEAKGLKRVAYAISFGTSEWEMNRKNTQECARLAKMFDLITAREVSGVDLCIEKFGVKAKLVLDPTLLLTKEDYINLLEVENTSASDGNLFYYLLDADKSKIAAVNAVGEKLRLKPFKVMPEFKGDSITKEIIKHHFDDCVFPPVTTWLRAFMDADMTIVDSFHGMVFSIIFNKPFWVIGNKKRGMSRFTSLLGLFGLGNRLISVDELANVDISEPINWDKVNGKIEEMKIVSLEILEKAFNNEICQK